MFQETQTNTGILIFSNNVFRLLQKDVGVIIMKQIKSKWIVCVQTLIFSKMRIHFIYKIRLQTVQELISISVNRYNTLRTMWVKYLIVYKSNFDSNCVSTRLTWKVSNWFYFLQFYHLRQNVAIYNIVTYVIIKIYKAENVNFFSHICNFHITILYNSFICCSKIRNILSV